MCILRSLHRDEPKYDGSLFLQGLAAGTLLYVTFFEVLEREKLEKVGMTGLLGAALLIIGFSLMAGLEAAGRNKFYP